MEDDAKFLLGAYQKKSFDLFNQVIATEARVQHYSEIIEAQKAKIDKFSGIKYSPALGIKVLL